VNFTLGPEENFTKVFEQAVKKAFKQELTALAKDITDTKTKNKIAQRFIGALSTEVQWTHRHYVKDDEYISYGENIEAFKAEIDALTKDITETKTKNKAVKPFLASLSTEVEWTHRHYVKDNEYIPFGEDIETFLNREIAKPIIRWADSPQLGYEILPNKYFYRYQPPTPAKELLAEFWRLEKEAEKLLEGLAIR
jgi:hypothetical protein